MTGSRVTQQDQYVASTLFAMLTIATAERGNEADGVDGVTEALLRASRALVAVAARSLAAVDSDVTLPQYRAMVVLRTEGPQNLGQLADALGIHSSSATRLCDRLVAKGQIDRQTGPSDRREVTLALTASVGAWSIVSPRPGVERSRGSSGASRCRNAAHSSTHSAASPTHRESNPSPGGPWGGPPSERVQRGAAVRLWSDQLPKVSP